MPRPDLVLIYKKKKTSGEFCGSSGLPSENKGKRIDGQILRPCQTAEKAVEHECNSGTINTQRTSHSPLGLEKETGKVGN